MSVKEQNRTREVVLAETLDIPIEKVFEIIPIPANNPYELAARINKKKVLGLDVSQEESIRKARLLSIELAKAKDEIKAGPLLKKEEASKLIELVEEILNELRRIPE